MCSFLLIIETMLILRIYVLFPSLLARFSQHWLGISMYGHCFNGTEGMVKLAGNIGNGTQPSVKKKKTF